MGLGSGQQTRTGQLRMHDWSPRKAFKVIKNSLAVALRTNGSRSDAILVP